MDNEQQKQIGWKNAEEKVYFKAQWGLALKLITAFTTVLLFALPSVLLFTAPRDFIPWIFLMPLTVVAVSSLFMVRGYVLTPDILYVRRLLWKTKVPLAGLYSAVVDTDAVKKSIRTCGNGGMFSFTGWFWNKQLGAFRAFATNSKDVVVMRFDKRTVVVTPSRPGEFVDFLKTTNEHE